LIAITCATFIGTRQLHARLSLGPGVLQERENESVRVCVCERERDRESVCVRERERQADRKRLSELIALTFAPRIVAKCVCARERERERESVCVCVGDRQSERVRKRQREIDRGLEI